MFNTIITGALAATSTVLVFATINLIEDLEHLREAVNMIEEAAHQINESAGRIDEDLDVFPLIAAQNRCEYERGEWHYETEQCYLQILGGGQ